MPGPEPIRHRLLLNFIPQLKESVSNFPVKARAQSWALSPKATQPVRGRGRIGTQGFSISISSALLHAWSQGQALAREVLGQPSWEPAQCLGKHKPASRLCSHHQAKFTHCGWHVRADGHGTVCFSRESMFEVLTIFKTGAKSITAAARSDHHTGVLLSPQVPTKAAGPG
jgi:hypothetical protein